MSFALVPLLLIVSAAALGVATGWTLRGCPGRGPLPQEESHPGREEPRDDSRHASEVLVRLRDLTARVAANLGEHNSRVEEINEELSSVDASENDAVMRAVDKLVHANHQMQQQLSVAQEKLRDQAQLIESHAHQARTDALTGLANRRAFDDEMARHRAEFLKRGANLSVTMVDIDHFKKFNDTYGHQAGDEVLRRVAAILNESASMADLVARYGGEEFALIHPGCPVDEAKLRAEQCRARLEAASISLQGRQVRVTASMGVAQLAAGDQAEALIRRADAALYAAKEAGRNRVYWHDGQTSHPVDALPAASRRKTEQEEDTRAESSALPSRAAFHTLLGNRLAEWQRGGPAPAVLFVQINNYHGIVSCHGTAAGTLIVRAMSQFLSAATRGSDVVARYDGPIFAMVMPGISPETMAAVAERLRHAVEQCSLPMQNGSLRFTVSLGGALATEGDNAERLLERAKQGLDSANELGGNRTRIRGAEAVDGSSDGLCEATGR